MSSLGVELAVLRRPWRPTMSRWKVTPCPFRNRRPFPMAVVKPTIISD